MSKLTMVKPRLASARQAHVAMPPKVADPFYLSAAWRGPDGLRAQAMARDRYTCVVPGCERPAVAVDHKVSRRRGGRDELANLQSLCRDHDNAWKEDHLGERRGGVGV